MPDPHDPQLRGYKDKTFSKRRLLALMCEVGMIYVETMQPVGEIGSAELVESAATSRSMNKLAKTVMKLMLMMGLGPLGAEGQEEFCNTAEQHGANENFWIAIFLFALVLSWMVLGVAAVWFWGRLDRRLYFNELQQAETDSFMGAQRDTIDDLRHHVQRVDNDLRAHVDQYEIVTDVMEDLVTTVHYGLVEIGGLVRHTELTKQQRESMLVQERANLVLFNMRQRAPDARYYRCFYGISKTEWSLVKFCKTNRSRWKSQPRRG